MRRAKDLQAYDDNDNITTTKEWSYNMNMYDVAQTTIYLQSSNTRLLVSKLYTRNYTLLNEAHV